MSNFRGGKVPSQESIDKADKIREEMVKEHLDIILKHRKGMSKNDALDEIEKAVNNMKNDLWDMHFDRGIDQWDCSQIDQLLNQIIIFTRTFKSVEESCLNCKHYDLEAEDEPCNHCRHAFDSELLSKFEEKESKDD